MYLSYLVFDIKRGKRCDFIGHLRKNNNDKCGCSTRILQQAAAAAERCEDKKENQTAATHDDF